MGHPSRSTTGGGVAQAMRAPRDVRMHPLWLRFDDPNREAAFRDAHDRESLSTLRVAGALGIALYAIFALLDTQAAESGLQNLLIMRAVVIVVIASCVAATFQGKLVRHQQLLVCLPVLAGGLGIASMHAIATVPEAMPAMGTMLTLIFLFGFVRARIVPAAVTALLIVTGYELALLTSEPSALTVAYLNFELLSFLVVGVLACHTLERLRRRDFLRSQELELERGRSDALLHNVLPRTIAERLRIDPKAIADGADEVTVLFADIVGFTPLTERTEPRELVASLDRLFARFDAVCDEHGVQKIKTIGDGYMAVAGVPDPHDDHAAAVAAVALGMRAAAGELASEDSDPLQLRVGICTGPVVAGVIGRRGFAYDLWGDTVNTASRLESHAAPGAIQVCSATRALIEDRFALRGPNVVELKGKGRVEAWELVGPEPLGGAVAMPTWPTWGSVAGS